MKKSLRIACGLALLVTGSLTASDCVAAQTLSELNAFWTESERTAAEGDAVGAAALYHEDAVLVSMSRNRSLPIATAMVGWVEEYNNTRSGKTSSVVSFRFSQRLNDETTAHETGIFNYRFVSETGEVSDRYIHFQALLIKEDGWKMMMEYQLTEATLDEWQALEARDR